MHIDPHGFREYDARWRIGVDIDLDGVAAVGRAMATLMRRRGLAAEIVTGHDFRSYSETVKRALVSGLKTAGLVVHDLGLAFDGDGDRCGFVDGMGRAISADKMGLLLARDLAARVPAASFIVDIKSTGLVGADPELLRHGAVERITQHYARALARAEPVCGHGIASIETINGVRFTLQDGSWGLVRASSNQPQLTVVCESPVSEAMMHAVLREIGQHLSTYEDVGALELLS